MTVLNGLGRWDFGAEFKNIYLMPAEQFKSTLNTDGQNKGFDP